MANTFTQIHIHVVFAVQNRQSLILENWEFRLHKYITTIIQAKGHKVLAIGGMPDHVHILIGWRPEYAISDLMRKVKSETSKWINENKFVLGKFSWQEGYGAFSYSKSQVPRVIKYVLQQKLHHKSKTFIDEYKKILIELGIQFDERYLFHNIE
ncbi:MAG: IS200/IS605 family transposase [Bacteroidales bacterium]|nr:IS200/IS605 family transposase [Bacteroidales bacterium]